VLNRKFSSLNFCNNRGRTIIHINTTMKRSILILLLITLGYNISNAQKKIIDGNIQINFKKAKKAPKLFYTVQNVKVKGENIKKIMVRCKIKSKNKEAVDVNPFSLIDKSNKVRYRMVEFVGYKPVSFGLPTYQGKEILKKNLVNKKGRPFMNLPKYDPTIKDTFNNFDFEGYKIIESAINFRTKKKPLLSVTYYAPITMNSFIADAFFVIQKFEKKPNFELYYGNEKIADIKIK